MDTGYTKRIFTLGLALAHLSGCAGYSHYAGWENRDIKALSPSDISDLRAGLGMRAALAAELNGYPGPLHVLQLSGKLELTASQREATHELYLRMKAAAVTAGEELIDAERDLDRLFATRAVDKQQLDDAMARVAISQARLRGTHLQAHLEQVRILTPEQVTRYNKLRGYGA